MEHYARAQRKNAMSKRSPVVLIQTADAIKAVLRAIGEDVTREGLRETPLRYARFMHEWLEVPPPKFTTFRTENMSELVVQTGITFYSLCEHHLLPFFGTATVGYLPRKKLVGLSKLARAVQYCARGRRTRSGSRWRWPTWCSAPSRRPASAWCCARVTCAWRCAA
jgi:GTP cyclohydrolase I